MEHHTKFLSAGTDGDLAPGINLWRKGLVYTTRAAPPSYPSDDANYRISVGFKKGLGAHPFTGFHDVYGRVATVANRRISQLTCPDTGKMPDHAIVCNSWRLLGDSIVTALITMDVQCSGPSRKCASGKQAPTQDELRAPGGSTLEELSRVAPQLADEIYNEFDFTDVSNDTGPITLSYGQSIPGGESLVDFRPFVERAEVLARSYHALLQSLGEVRAGLGPATVFREWFLASDTFVTVHICFDR